LIKITKNKNEFKLEFIIDKAYYKKRENYKKDMTFRLIGYKSEEKIKITYNDFIKYKDKVSELFGSGMICKENHNIMEYLSEYDSSIINFTKLEKANVPTVRKFIRLLHLKAFSAQILRYDVEMPKTFDFVLYLEKPKRLSKEEEKYVHYWTLYYHIVITSVIIIYKLDQILSIKLKTDIYGSVIWMVTKALSDAYANYSDKIITRKLIVNKIFPIYNLRLNLLKTLIDPKSFKNIPNRKYTTGMFSLVMEKMMDGKKQYVAVEDTIKELDITDTDPESFARSFRKYLSAK